MHQTRIVYFLLLILLSYVSGDFTQQGPKLVGTGYSGTSYQGHVSLSDDGNTLAVGGLGDNANVGATWIFVRNGTTWTQQGLKLVGTGYSGTSYQCRVSLSGDGNTLAVGGFGDNANVGATWIFVRNGTTWTQQGLKLVGTGYSGTSQQGFVSLSGDGNTLAVGGLGDNAYIGATWIFVRNGTTWAQQGLKLVGTGYSGASYQGVLSLSGDGNTLAVGGLGDNAYVGATWIFVRNGTTWTQQGLKLVGTGYSGTSYQCRVSLSDDGNTLAVGGYNDDANVGATWIFVRNGTTWTQQGLKLVGTGYSGSTQGFISLSGDGNTLAVGGLGDNATVGATWIFVRNGTTWTQQGLKLVGAGYSGASKQGRVSLSGDGNTLAVGGESDNANVGAAWIFFNNLTLAPTSLPTFAPISSSTLAPTFSPTLAPTFSPTLAPTSSSTLAPTSSSTLAPINAPTANPECFGPWIPIQIFNGVSSLCSACIDGASFFFRNVNYNLSFCQNVTNHLSLTCSFPCQLNSTQSPNITSLLFDNNYLQGVFTTLQIPDQFQIVEYESTVDVSFTCNNSLNSTYVSYILSTLINDAFPGHNFPVEYYNCSFHVGKFPNSVPNLSLFALLSLTVLIIVAAWVLKYYYGSVLHRLPPEISWSFIDKLTHPWRWTNRIEYYIREYAKDSNEWRRVQNLLSTNIYPSKIFAIYNPTLTVSFINQWEIFTMRFRDNPEVFFAKNFNKNSQKMWVMDQFDSLCSQFSWNVCEYNQIPLLPVFHGTDFFIAEKIAQTGFAVLSTLDAGYFGKGIYFTSHLFYTLPYSSVKQNPAVIVSFVALGNVYPVTEDHKGPKKLLGAALKSGYNSHFVITNHQGCVYDPVLEEGTALFDEIVVGQESQILPAFILLLDSERSKTMFLEWDRAEQIPTHSVRNGLEFSFDECSLLSIETVPEFCDNSEYDYQLLV